ncbi:MAG: hypothetical protein HC799_01515 [Limnothrix sp. RL_2_0]|nr:hypothetical protein [Limnothrix sp. RL_2_0]
MNVLQQSLILAGAVGVTSFITAKPAQALAFSILYTDIDTENLFDADLRLMSGGDPDFVNSQFKNPFNLDDEGEFFELFVEKVSLGKYACYSADNITNLNGVLHANAGCDFDMTLSSLGSIFQGQNQDFLGAIADGSLLIETLFTGSNNGTYNYSLQSILTTYYQAPLPDKPLPTPVPTPVMILPIVGGLLLKARGDRPENFPTA